MLLKDKVALITAGASGMGRAAAELFAREGAQVIVVDINDQAAKDTVSAIEAAGGSAASAIVDVRDLGALKALAEQVQKEHGKLHILYNNVGIPGAAGLDLTEEEWNTGLEINARASFFLSGYLTEALKAAEGASVIFTSSTSGLIGSPYSPIALPRQRPRVLRHRCDHPRGRWHHRDVVPHHRVTGGPALAEPR